MKALSVHQPWATLIALGLKTVELRSWETKHRGPLLICSTRRADDPDKWVQAPVRAWCAERGIELRGLPAGVTVCIVTLEQVAMATPADMFASCSEPTGFLWAWRLGKEIQRVKERPMMGRLGIYEVPDDFVLRGKCESIDCREPEPVKHTMRVITY